MSRLPVVAAVPNYNMANHLGSLLPTLADQEYEEIYVLDDASTDNSREVVEGFSRDLDLNVHFVQGEENLGSGGNRNRIIPALGHEAIIHFIDADVRLISNGNVALAKEAFKDKSTGLVGGLITLPDGTPWMFNYGGRQSYAAAIGGWLQVQTNLLASKHPAVAKSIRSATAWFLDDYPDITKLPEPKNVFWVGEANMLIPSKLFAEVGGFDPTLRYHEAHDIAHKLHDRGYKVRFNPRIQVEHPDFDLANMRNEDHADEASRIIKRKYGRFIK